MINKIDHFAIGARDLASGQQAFEAATGIHVSMGSKHDAMSTHNFVCQAGNESFFELIAIDPDAPHPGRVRWFTLDDPKTQARLNERPRALVWVVNTTDLDAVVAASPIDLGEIVHFKRGDRTWRLAVPKDGHLPEGGTVPSFIEWSPGPHPSAGQQALGLELTQVSLSHPDPEYLSGILKALKVDHLASISQGALGLSFDLSTPKGKVTID